MKLKLSSDEARAALGTSAKPHFTNVDNLTAVVRTDPEWVHAVLPDPLAPTNPMITVTLSQSDQFRGVVVGLQCVYDGIEGEFSLGHVMDSDLRVILGREGLAEPKKLGEARISETNGRVIARPGATVRNLSTSTSSTRSGLMAPVSTTSSSSARPSPTRVRRWRSSGPCRSLSHRASTTSTVRSPCSTWSPAGAPASTRAASSFCPMRSSNTTTTGSPCRLTSTHRYRSANCETKEQP